ncbi:hypothetical protein GGR56DRAFT_162805 [Xylariaceae sp. FL0804]|nr:hypothetical protein GGR56DRAFT_162805 [Xylariaceae sp. FL0804]
MLTNFYGPGLPPRQVQSLRIVLDLGRCATTTRQSQPPLGRIPLFVGIRGRNHGAGRPHPDSMSESGPVPCPGDLPVARAYVFCGRTTRTHPHSHNRARAAENHTPTHSYARARRGYPAHHNLFRYPVFGGMKEDSMKGQQTWNGRQASRGPAAARRTASFRVRLRSSYLHDSWTCWLLARAFVGGTHDKTPTHAAMALREWNHTHHSLSKRPRTSTCPPPLAPLLRLPL